MKAYKLNIILPEDKSQLENISLILDEKIISMIGGDSEYLGNFINRYREIEKGMARKERTPLKHCTENIWLVKPENMN